MDKQVYVQNGMSNGSLLKVHLCQNGDPLYFSI